VSAHLPGTRLHRLLARWADPLVLRDVITPTIADLQYETRAVTRGPRRWLVVARGYGSLLHALTISGLDSGGVLRAAFALAPLILVGTLLVQRAAELRVDGRVLNSALLTPLFAAPFVLRAAGVAGWRRLFVGSVLVALMMRLLAEVVGTAPAPVGVAIVRLLASMVLAAPFSATAAVLARPGSARRSRAEQLIVAVAVGSGVATLAFGLVNWPDGVQFATGIAMAPFYVAIFGMLLALTLAPGLLLLGRRVRSRWRLATLGVLLSPLALLLSVYVDGGTARDCLDHALRAPGAFLLTSAPFVTAALAMGWTHAGGTPASRTD
jgi:hypothetical protein